MAISNEQARRNSGQSMADARRAGGQAAEAARRAAGETMVQQRTGAAEAADINALVTTPRQRKTLRTLDPRGGLPAQVGVGKLPGTGNSQAGGGIASPLTEKTKLVGGQTVPDADYWPAGYTSSDGLFVLPARKTERFTDANDAEVVFEFANPQGTAP